MEKYIKLLKNIGIFSIGNLGSKILMLLIVPLYTFVLTTSEYGTVDTIITLTSLLLPCFTLAIYEAVLRYALQSSYSTQTVFTNCFIVMIMGFLIFTFGVIVIDCFINFDYLFSFIVLMVSQGIYTFVQQFSKGIGKNKVYTISGLIYTLIMLFLNILFLLYLRRGIVGYLWSMIIGYLISSLYVLMVIKAPHYFDIAKLSVYSIKEYVSYSLPLIPNNIMWWAMNSSSKFFILYYLGLSANGIYAIAYKIPTIINMISQIFFQAWQISAIEEAASDSKGYYYSKVYNFFSTIMFLGASFLLVILKPLITNVLASDYTDAWKYIPFLVVAVVFSSFSSFIGVNYIVLKKTKGVFSSSLVGAIINCFFCFVLIPRIGLYGASIAMLLSYVMMWYIRIKDTKRYLPISVDKFNYVFNVLMIVIQTCFLYTTFSGNTFILFALLIFQVFYNFNHIVKEIKK